MGGRATHGTLPGHGSPADGSRVRGAKVATHLRVQLWRVLKQLVYSQQPPMRLLYRKRQKAQNKPLSKASHAVCRVCRRALVLAMHRCKIRVGRVTEGRIAGAHNDFSHGVRIIRRAADVPCVACEEMPGAPSAPTDLLSVRCWTVRRDDL